MNVSKTPTQVYLLFDERMALHRPPPCTTNCNRKDDESDAEPFENSARIICLYDKLMELEERLYNENHSQSLHRLRFIPLQPHPCDRATIELVHSHKHYNNMLHTCELSDKELYELSLVNNDLYYCRDTFLAATLACGGVVNCVDAVLNSHVTGGGPTRAIALVRPPGHHALRDEPMGFCYFNNIAVAAKHAIHSGQADKVFILDWDIHHGNGIQELTYKDPNIFYLSIHRASFGKSRSAARDWFYPGTGRHNETGNGPGAGTNLNIVWPHGGMGNAEYAAAFSEVVLPVLSAFDPDLIIIACGLDAAQGDLIGDCGLSADMYYIMTKSLLETAGREIPIVAALEGGYELETIASCMEAVALALLDEPWSQVPRNGHERVLGSRSIMDSGRHELILRNQEFDLSRYWRHDEFDCGVETERHGATSRAVSSIKKSAKALANNGTCVGCMHFIADPHVEEDMTNQNFVTDYRFCGVEKRTPLLPRNHRPRQDGCLPFKKRKLFVEAEAASTLLSLTEKYAC